MKIQFFGGINGIFFIIIVRILLYIYIYIIDEFQFICRMELLFFIMKLELQKLNFSLFKTGFFAPYAFC